MKKTLLASAIAVTALGSVNASADIAVTNMVFGPTYGVTGTLLSGGGGSLQSTGFFFGHTFNASQDTIIMNNSGTWGGTWGNATPTIAAMTANQRAVGMLFNWSTSSNIHVLEVFNCNDDGSGDACSGNGVPMFDGPFVGSVATFSGAEVSAVPVPAAVWLMGSGLLGLVGVARRRKQA